MFPKINPSPFSHPRPSMTAEQVKIQLRKISAWEAADQLSYYLKNALTSFVKLWLICSPWASFWREWKTYYVAPVTEITHAMEPRHFRLVFLMSYLMKNMERVMLRYQQPLVSAKLDPQQYVYQPGYYFSSAQIPLTIGEQQELCEIHIFCFSFLFNTKHPLLLRGKLIEVGVVTWLCGLLTTSTANHSMWGCMTVCLEWEPAALEPCRGRCSPLFWSLFFTSDFTRNTSNCRLQKFSSDTAIVWGCIWGGWADI